MEETNLGENYLSGQNPEEPGRGLQSQAIERGLMENTRACYDSEVPQCPEASSNLGKLDKQEVSAKNSRRSSQYGKKTGTRNGGKKYLLRSSFSSARVLRSMSKVANQTAPPISNNPVNHITQRRKKRGKKLQRASLDEFVKIRSRVRYLLHRMSYEQSLIDAYAGEGWKGQSSEKIKPEMELQRAKSEILRCKLKIRILFQQLDSSISDGKLDDSLFDSEGEICSEDICCAKCRSKDVYADNDIILCDGICDRGFHQNCLNPPLLHVPPGDEGWLCPGCDCKADSVDLINETQGTDLSIEDEWERVFPEATAFSPKNGQHDDLELPSDDSEDHDYDPDHLEADEELKEGSSSDESHFTSTSEEIGASNHDLQDQNFGFPSDDSEDVDYDPDKRVHHEKAAEDNSSSDESDFTSDTDDFSIPDDVTSDVNVVSASSISKYPRHSIHSGKASDVGAINKSSDNSVLSSLKLEMGQENVAPLSSKRQREHLDHKELHDEACGNHLSDLGSDEEWTEMSIPKNLNHDTTREDIEGLVKRLETVENQSSKYTKVKRDFQNKIMHPVCADMNESSQKSEICVKVQKGLVNHSVDEQNPDLMHPDASEKRTSRSSRKYSTTALQKLQESFRENQYPSRETKGSLARELGMTAQQVSKWFENARHSYRMSAKEAITAGPSSVSATSCRETSNNMNAQKAMGSSPSKGLKQNTQGESHDCDISETQRSKDGGATTKKVTIDPIDRQILVMRELRKRRKSR